jgi:hypothetical protein
MDIYISEWTGSTIARVYWSTPKICLTMLNSQAKKMSLDEEFVFRKIYFSYLIAIVDKLIYSKIQFQQTRLKRTISNQYVHVS